MLLTEAPGLFALARGRRGRCGAHLLDHVNQQLAQRDRRPGTVLANETEVGVARELLRERDFVAPRGPRFVDNDRVWDSTVEVAVGFGVRLIELWDVVACEAPAKPAAFDLGHVAQQARSDIVDGSTARRASCAGSRPSHFSWSVSRWHRRFDKSGPLVAERSATLARVSVGLQESVCAVRRLGHSAILAGSGDWRSPIAVSRPLASQ